jgi:hypothetical protein
VLEIEIRRYKVEKRRITSDQCSQIRAYANDIMGRGLKGFEELLKSPVGQTNKIGLEINRKKQNI